MSGQRETSTTPGVRDRLLAAADELFYAEGIHAVGIDRLLAHAGVAKASLYHHFDGKDGLVVAYLDSRSFAIEQSLRHHLAPVDGDAHTRINVIFADIWSSASQKGFHGCPFINAAAEFPHASHPVMQAITRHRLRFAAVVSEQLALGGLPAAPDVVGAIVVTYDGAMVSAQVDQELLVRGATTRILDALIARSGLAG